MTFDAASGDCSHSPGAGTSLRHVAFIMDGNGRWAEKRGKTRAAGHREGAETVDRVVRHAAKLGIPYLTLYAFSSENWSRPKTEVDALMRLLERFLLTKIPDFMKNDIRLRAIGDIEGLPPRVRKALAEGIERTRGNARLSLALALNYGGRDEIVRAARNAAKALAAGGGDFRDLTDSMISAHLDLPDLPDPDLIVRTAGEKRLSNFLIWQAAYAELYWCEKTWPEFTEIEFDLAVADYHKRVRKFGGI